MCDVNEGGCPKTRYSRLDRMQTGNIIDGQRGISSRIDECSMFSLVEQY